MRLKRVRVFGFKTFADRTDFDVDGSVIAVVGPNGCGKSNLVDAILWGLGEGTPRELRAESGQDVIFAGSAKRKSLGYAEVTLLFDNEDGTLPIETSEVAITRRLTKGGESDYEINRRRCRLKDVLELLADSGLGRAGYAIVAQRDIDQALAASPEDRRAWIDEAAGVMRYRTRKAEALRRMESAKSHLDRVRDLIAEIDSQREPLKDEAEVAARYKSLLASLREVESGLLIVEVARTAKDVVELQVRIEESSRLADKETKLAAGLERELERETETISSLENDLDGFRARQHKALSEFERAEAELKLGAQKLTTLDELEKGISDEAGASGQRITDAEAEVEAARKEVSDEQQRLSEVRLVTAGAGKEAKKLSAKMSELDAEIAESRAVRAESQKRQAENEHRQERVEEIKRELEGIDGALPEVRKAHADAEKAYSEHEKGIAKTDAAERALNEEFDKLDEQKQKAADARRELLEEKAHLEGRLRGIEATVATFEGLQQGAREVLDAAKSGKLKGKFKLFGACIEVEKAYANAIEAALESAANDLVVEDSDLARSAIEFLKVDGLGRATFRPLDLAHKNDSDLSKALHQKGVIAKASDLVQCDEKTRPLVESLLGGTLVVESLERAIDLTGSKGWERIATLDGETIHRSGSITGGQGAKPMYGVVKRKADLAELRKQIAEIDRDLKMRETEDAKLAREQEKVQEKIDEAEVALEGLRKEADDARRWLHEIEEELNATLKTQARLLHERKQLSTAGAQKILEVDLESLESERDAILKEIAAHGADVEHADERLREAEFRLEQAKFRLEQAEKRLNHYQDLAKSRERKIRSMEPERKAVRAEIAQAQKKRDEAVKERELVGKELDEAQERRRASIEQTFALTEQIKASRAAVQSATEQSHAAEVSRARADSKRAAVAQRLLEDYNLTEQEALAQEPPEIPKDAASVTARLRREIKEMGDVNVGAIEAYERLTTRFDELQVQSEDILAGMSEVEASIRELDGLTREKFLRTFEAVQGAFAEIFNKLFPGGAGSVRLTDPKELLTTGIEIDVQLPGKKRQKLELLSGGERSLCATAFLFALLKVKPSPLVVLDEVDAPLDGHNVERFNQLLRDFSPNSQFIVITHNPATIAAAPVWVGVTMQEPGVSTLVPAKLPANESADRNAVVLA